VAPAVLPPVFLKLIWRHKNTGGKTAGATENIGDACLARRSRDVALTCHSAPVFFHLQ
jgi:hypothetical protein